MFQKPALLLFLLSTALSGQQLPDAAVPLVGESWKEVLARAERDKKPIVVLFRTPDCARCDDFERNSLTHPSVGRRLPSVIVTTLPIGGEGSQVWTSEYPGLALFDRSGALRGRWLFVPGTSNLIVILDSVIAVAPHFERAVQLTESGRPHKGELEAAVGLRRLGRNSDARAAIERAFAGGNDEARQAAIVARAALDATEGNLEEPLAELEKVIASATSPEIVADAWITIGQIHRASGATDQAIRAFTTAAQAVGSTSPLFAAANQALAEVRATSSAATVVRILPLDRQVVSGRQTVKTQVTSAAVRRVTFSIDGREKDRVERPPFSTTLDFGRIPERRSIRVAAFDEEGQEIGRDERIVNEGGEAFWLRLVEPREGAASGVVKVAINLRTPTAHRVRRVVLTWNQAERAVLTTPPWETRIDVPSNEVGVLRAIAELDDGRTSEDAVLLNAGGMVEKANVLLVELPLTILGKGDRVPSVPIDRIMVREGSRTRQVDSVSTAAETPLTVGLVIDSSASMHDALPDVQEAAIRFLESVLGKRDRAFLITFDQTARLVQPATADIGVLRGQIMRIRAGGPTALYDAMALGLMAFEGIKGRRALVIFSDGIDQSSGYNAGEVGNLARRVNVPVHVIASVPPRRFAQLPTRLPDGTVAEMEDARLRRISHSTGGTTHVLRDLSSLSSVFAQIEAALRAQLLAFISTEPGTRENDWRSITVTVRGQDLEVHAPEGYYAPW